MSPRVPAYCLHCLRPVTLDFKVPDSPPDNQKNTWTCPHDDCGGENEVVRIVVTKVTPRIISSERQAQERKHLG